MINFNLLVVEDIQALREGKASGDPSLLETQFKKQKKQLEQRLEEQKREWQHSYFLYLTEGGEFLVQICGGLCSHSTPVIRNGSEGEAVPETLEIG